MPVPTPLPGPGTPGVVVCQCTLIFGSPKNGWSETHYLHCSGGTTPLDAAAARIKSLAEARRAVMPNAFAVEAVRISDVNVRGDSFLGIDAASGCGFGMLVSNPANPALGWFTIERELTGTIRDTRLWRGWAAADLVYNELDPRSLAPTGAPLAFLTAWANEAVSPRTLLGTITQFCIRAHARPGMPGITVFSGFLVGTDPGGFLQLLNVAPLIADFKPGALIHVTAPRTRCVRGVSGTHRITRAEVIAGQATYTLATKYACNPADLALLVAKAYVDQTAFFAINRVIVGGQGKRDTGRRFFVSRGRQPNSR